jgi:hypothetical protein
MDNPRPQLAADAAQIVHVMEQRVDERPRRVAGAGMHDHSRRLVQDDDVRVLIQDVQIERLRRELRRLRRRHVDRDPCSVMDERVRFEDDGPVNADAAVRNQPLQLRP